MKASNVPTTLEGSKWSVGMSFRSHYKRRQSLFHTNSDYLNGILRVAARSASRSVSRCVLFSLAWVIPLAPRVSPIDDCERVSDCRPSANELQGEEGGGCDVGAILLERFQTHGLSKLISKTCIATGENVQKINCAQLAQFP